VAPRITASPKLENADSVTRTTGVLAIIDGIHVQSEKKLLRDQRLKPSANAPPERLRRTVHA
jgi:hypothetical protein